MKLTEADIKRYAPYHLWPEFKLGYEDYLAGRRQELSDVPGQAYDRGAECAMRHQTAAHRQRTAELEADRP